MVLLFFSEILAFDNMRYYDFCGNNVSLILWPMIKLLTIYKYNLEPKENRCINLLQRNYSISHFISLYISQYNFDLQKEKPCSTSLGI